MSVDKIAINAATAYTHENTAPSFLCAADLKQTPLNLKNNRRNITEVYIVRFFDHCTLLSVNFLVRIKFIMVNFAISNY